MDRRSFRLPALSYNSSSFFQMPEHSIDGHHLRSVDGMTGRWWIHGWLLHLFFTTFSILDLDNFPANKDRTYENNYKKRSRHTSILKKVHWKVFETLVHQYTPKFDCSMISHLLINPVYLTYVHYIKSKGEIFWCRCN